MSPELREIQARMLELLLAHDGVAASSRRLSMTGPDGPGLVVSDRLMGAEGRLDVYARMYVFRAMDALASQFPRLAAAVGSDVWEALVRAYVADRPSHSFTLRDWGADLPAWLAIARSRQGFDDRRLPWLADLARLEWARADVFDGPDESTWTMDALRDLTPTSLAAVPLRPVATHRRLHLHHAVDGTWDALAEAAEVSDPAAEPCDLLVWRQDVRVFHRRLGADERDALRLLAAGTTLGAFCEQLSSGQDPEAATRRAFSLLATWATDGLLAVTC